MSYPREVWGARPPKSLTMDGPKHTVFIHHSDGLGNAFTTKAEQRACMRSIQNYHMDHNGWNDIGYAFVVFQPEGSILHHARVYDGRNVHAIPAAQLGHNTGTIPVCVVGNFQIERVQRVTKERLIEVVRNLKKEFGIHSIKGHRDVNQTDCPGDHLYPLVSEIRRTLALS